MGKMRMESLNLTSQNVEKIEAIFPNCITESRDENGQLKKSVNFKLLKQILSEDIVDGEEAYEFTWVGKKESIVEANKPIRKTLRPAPEESVDWENTENLYIEGDNLEVLKLLQESYLGKVKMIYIDPPYNTGNDFIYNDDFKVSNEEYAEESGKYDEDGNRMFKNTDSNGRFHSDWCSMMYSRLLVAKNLLKEDGVIFISIDDNEVENLKKICNEVFGSENFISQFIWQNKKGGGNDSRHVAIEHEYVLSYSKNKTNLQEFYKAYTDQYKRRYNEVDEYGHYYWDTFKRKSGKQYYPIECPDGEILEYDDDGNPISWLRSKERFKKDIEKGEIRIVKIKNKWSVQFKQRIPKGKKPRSLFKTEEIISNKGTTSSGNEDVYKYFKKDVFSNPKPLELISFLLEFGVEDEDIVLDFFSGSGTVAESVMLANLHGKKIKYILIQLREYIDIVEKGGNSVSKIIQKNAREELDKIGKESYITELAKERIRRAGNQIKNDNPLLTSNLDTGFRVLKVDSSNMKDVYYLPNEISQDFLSSLESNIKEDRTDLDLLFGCLLEWGLPLSLPYKSIEIDGCVVHNYNDGDLIACFEENISENVMKEIAKLTPLRAVFRDSSFENSAEKINTSEIFKLLSPDSKIKVI